MRKSEPPESYQDVADRFEIFSQGQSLNPTLKPRVVITIREDVSDQ